MSSINLIIVRHGTTLTNVEGRFCGAPDYPLSKSGIEYITNLIKDHPYPQVDHLYTSPATRAKQTLELCFGKDEFDVLDDLKELYFGKAEMCLARAIYKEERYATGLQSYDENFAFDDGETIKHCTSRGVSAIKKIISEALANNYQTVGVVTHSFVLSLILRAMLIELPENPVIFFTPNGMGVKLEVDMDRIEDTKCLRFIETMPKGAEFPDLKNNPYLKK